MDFSKLDLPMVQEIGSWVALAAILVISVWWAFWLWTDAKQVKEARNALMERERTLVFHVILGVLLVAFWLSTPFWAQWVLSGAKEFIKALATRSPRDILLGRW